MSRELLERKFADLVTCIKIDAPESLGDVCREMGEVDLVFHDADHSAVAYRRDFAAIEPSLVRGAVLILDDIYWNNPLAPDDEESCYNGWIEISRHPRVRHAIEVNNQVGLVQFD
jgi:predicted O-methyltransferase YrrM